MLIRRVDDLEIRRLEPRDAGALATLEPGDLSQSQGEWTSARGREAEFIVDARCRFEAGEGFWAGIWRGADLLGIVALHHIKRAASSGSLSYALGAQHRGRGVMTRACAQVVDHGFGELGLNRLQIVVDVANRPSRGIPERLGFTQEGVFRDFYRSADGFRDVVQYALLAREWRGAGPTAAPRGPS
jgi:ribosomal-protein-serine acetyltransferase